MVDAQEPLFLKSSSCTGADVEFCSQETLCKSASFPEVSHIELKIRYLNRSLIDLLPLRGLFFLKEECYACIIKDLTGDCFHHTYMTKDLALKAKQLLLKEKLHLETELSKFSHRNSKTTESEFVTDFEPNTETGDDNASEVAQFSDNLSLEDELEKALRDVESALKQVDKGDYGTCKYCHQPIDERRLLARPTSSSCIQCKKTLTQEV